jgi:hypothetical protein
MTRKAIVLWLIGLAGLIVGGVLLRMSDGVRTQVGSANATLAATQREAARIAAGPANPMPLSVAFSSRNLLPSNITGNVSIERAPANDVFNALIDYERKGLGAISQFAFAFPEPGRASGSATPLALAPIPAAQK